MKRKINFIPAIIILTAFAAALWLVPYIIDNEFSPSDLSWSRYKPFIHTRNEPDGTAYVDILVKMDASSEDYTEFNELQKPPKRLVRINEVTEAVESETGERSTQTRREPVYEEVVLTPDSGIAKFNDGGYVSLSLHCKGVRGFQINDYSTQLILTEQREFDIEELYKRYENFKAAYVDENGEVLKVTDRACVQHDPDISSRFSTRGEELNLTICGGFSAQNALTCVMIFGRWATMAALAVFIVLAVMNKVKFSKQSETETMRNIHYAPRIAVLAVCVVAFPIIVLGNIFSAMGRTHDYIGSQWDAEYSFKNAPEGTAYIDLLVKLPESSEDYVDFNEAGGAPKKFLGFKRDYYDEFKGREKVQRYIEYADYKQLNITPESGIATLNDDGYVSLSVHYKGCEGFSYRFYEHECRIVLSGSPDTPGGTAAYSDNFAMIAKRYGDFKAAYIGENGEVLKVTKPAKIKHWNGMSEISANGDKLTFRVYKRSAFADILLFIAIFCQLPALAGLIVCIVLALRQKSPSSLPNLDAREKKHNDL